MTPFVPPELIPAFPEISLAIMTLLMVVLGVAGREEDYKTISRFGILTLLAVALVTWRLYDGGNDNGLSTFNGMFILEPFSIFMKILVVLGAAVSLAMATRYAERERIMRFEYPVLVLFSTLGMMLMISANDLMSLYIGIELQSLPLYVMAALQRDNVRSTEAGLKYFILGALSSGMFLYGASLLYGFAGSTGFPEIAASLSSAQGLNTLSATTGMVMLICALAFKVSAAPFHMWTPDVYEGAPTSVTAFFAIVPKVAALAMLTRVLTGPFGHIVNDWQQIIIILSIASMLLGAIAAVGQTNIKRMLAYSSIGHAGYALVGLASANEQGIQAVMIYAVIYMVMSIGAFCVVLMMKQKDQMLENISDLSGAAKTQPALAFAMAVIMFSMAGIPPMAGFLGKLFVFQAAVRAELYMLAVLGVMTSVISAFYYLRVIKVMYFDEPEDALDPVEDPALKLILGCSTIVLLVFIFMPAPLLNATQVAARTLLQ